MEIDSLLMNNKLSIISFILFFRWPPAHNYGTNNLVAIVFQLVGDCRGVCNWSNVTYVDALICRRHESLCPHSIRLLAIFMSVNNFLRTMCLWLSQWSLCSDFGWLRKQWSSSMFNYFVKDVDSSMQLYDATGIYYKHIAGVRMGAA